VQSFFLIRTISYYVTRQKIVILARTKKSIIHLNLYNMKRVLLLAMLAVFVSLNVMSQCGQVSLIGEFNGWADDHMMTRDANNPAEFTTFLTVTEADDVDPVDGVITMKFRANKDWTNNWGAADFPSGVAVLDGDNIPVPPGNYLVSFNCETGAYNFTATCGVVSMIGEFNGWAGDHALMRDPMNPDSWTGYIYLTEDMDTSDPPDGIVELKFRQNADWAVNWGSADFPTGTGIVDGDNIPVPIGNYKVEFNCATGEYTFTSTCGMVGLIGEFNGWAADYWMMRDPMNPDLWTVVLSLNDEMDTSDPPDGVVELKFRANSDWGTNWGSADFPTGTGVLDGDNIPVPLDETGISTDYYVTFNCATGEYSFETTSGPISMIGAFNDWNGDVMMTRDPMNPNMFTLTRDWFETAESKFRENKDWSANWGSADFPTGTGADNGDNIPVAAGTYDVTFDYSTKAYTFTANNEACGEISIIGDFNEWEASGFPTYMNRDPESPNTFTLAYNFTSATTLFFKMVDGQPIGNDNIWGGTTLCQTGVHDVTKLIAVSGGKYNITFNCLSGDYCFERLGNSVIAPKVFDMTVDGNLNEADWNIDQNVSRVIDGEATDDLNTVDFGVTYKSGDAKEGAYLFVGVRVLDAVPFLGDAGEIFIDGNKSGGAYDDFDLHATFGAGGITILQGPADLTAEDILLGFSIVPGSGYNAEVGIPLDKLGVTPEEGAQMGFDLFVNDDDGDGVAYTLGWNGGLENYENTSSFGDLNFGVLSCGCISVYNSTIGDVVLRNPTDMPTYYVGTYELFDAQDVVFRKDMQSTVEWSSDAFPTGVATIGGAMIPATADKYRISFDCISGEYNFDAAGVVPDEGIAMAQYTETAPTIDGDLAEYNLEYGSDVLVAGTGPNNNTVTWGAKWDASSLYIGAKVVDAVVEFTGNPWDNDAVEMYIDGNNDKDGAYDADFDTQLIVDANPEDTLWVKADGVPITDFDAIYKTTTDGYIVELRLAWSNFDFAPGRGRVMGFSLGNNDSDNNVGRDYQTVWYGTGSNWSNTGDLGDMQLAGGPFFFVDGINENVLYNANISLYPNPTTGHVNLRSIGDVFQGDVQVLVTDIQGRVITQITESFNGGNLVQFNMSNLTHGIYFVNILADDGKRAVKKLIVQ
jgi:hypothetical protein